MIKNSPYHTHNSLTGQLLIAMPSVTDPRFAKTVIFVCAHTSEGAVGIVINQQLAKLPFEKISAELGISPKKSFFKSTPKDIRMHIGGPVETARGFILHSTDYHADETYVVNDKIALTTSLSVIEDIAIGRGPEKSVFTMGYAGWAPLQLEQEIEFNSWIAVDADDELVFGENCIDKWEKALQKVGIDPIMLSSDAGSA